LKQNLAFGYNGYFKPKPNSPAAKLGFNPDGCALFYDKNALELLGTPIQETLKDPTSINLETEYNQVFILAKFREKASQFEFAVAVTHLKASKDETETRKKQVQYLLKQIKDFGVEYVFVLADFNAPAEEEAITQMVEAGFISSYAYGVKMQRDGNADNINLVEDEVRYTTWKTREKGMIRRTIDFLFYKGPQLTPIAILDVPDENLADPYGFPSWKYPSDHIALYTEFKISSNAN
jgi:mRNA deadenylase 3'-5' endonuclease subunit Ccr4